MKIITELPDTAYLPIVNPLIENAKNIEVKLKGEEDMRITPETTIIKINKLRSQVYEVDDVNKLVTDNITNPETQRDAPKYKPWVWNGINCRKSAGQRHKRDRLYGFDEESLRGITYLTTF